MRTSVIKRSLFLMEAESALSAYNYADIKLLISLSSYFQTPSESARPINCSSFIYLESFSNKIGVYFTD